VIAAVAVLAVAGGAGAAALVGASGDDDSAPVASTTTPTPTGGTNTGTATTPSRTETSTDGGTTTGGDTTTSESETETGTETESSAPTAPAEPPSTRRDRAAKRRLVKVPPARVFSGTGTKWLGTIEVAQPALVRWSAHGKLSIRFGRERFPVVAPSRSGQLVVPPYRFELVRVISSGSWRLTITPQG
jgi:hypothetical protein